jgi:fatty acid desaturase
MGWDNVQKAETDFPRAMRKTKGQRGKQQKAILIAIAAALVTAVVAAIAVTMWDKPREWVPILAGFAVGIITYALIAPQP